MIDIARMLTHLAGRTVLVVGDAMLDEYLYCAAVRMSAEAPVPVLAERDFALRLGGAANAAAGVLALGGRALLATALGDDADGDYLAIDMRAAGIQTQGLVRVSGRTTTRKLRLIAGGQQVVRVDREDSEDVPPAVEQTILERCASLVRATDAVLISDYAKGVVTPHVAAELIGLARAAGKPVIVDPKGTEPGKYAGCTVIKPNMAEAQALTGIAIMDADSLRAAGQRLIDRLGCAVIITQAGGGMTVLRPGDQPELHLAAEARQAVDVTGAGDTVAAALALALAGGVDLQAAARLASAAAAIAVSSPGTATVTRAELERRP